MVLPHAEPDESTPEDDDGGEQRQRDTDAEREKRASNHYVPDEAKEIADNLIESFKEIFKDEKAEWPDTGFHRSRWW